MEKKKWIKFLEEILWPTKIEPRYKQPKQVYKEQWDWNSDEDSSNK
jgi:hypothetical protein